MTDTLTARAAAEAAFRSAVVTPEEKQSGMSEYRSAREQARLRMAAQRAARLAAHKRS